MRFSFSRGGFQIEAIDRYYKLCIQKPFYEKRLKKSSWRACSPLIISYVFFVFRFDIEHKLDVDSRISFEDMLLWYIENRTNGQNLSLTQLDWIHGDLWSGNVGFDVNNEIKVFDTDRIELNIIGIDLIHFFIYEKMQVRSWKEWVRQVNLLRLDSTNFRLTLMRCGVCANNLEKVISRYVIFTLRINDRLPSLKHQIIWRFKSRTIIKDLIF
jgi:hypothetical protein